MDAPDAPVVPPYVFVQFFADLGRVSAVGPTVHIELGTTLPDGTSMRRAHVMMARDFARSMAESILRAVDQTAPGATKGQQEPSK